MKIDRVILAVDNNPTYTIYWNIVSKVWFDKFGIKPTLIFYGDEPDFEKNNFIFNDFEYKLLNPIPEISDPSPNWVVPWLLFWGASQYPNEVCLLCGIDQIPTSNFFFEKIKNYDDDKFIIGFSDAYKTYTKETLGYFNTQTNSMYPSSHLVGKGSLFKKIFDIDKNYKIELKKVFDSKEKYYLNNKFYKESKLWGLDECYGSDKISQYQDQKNLVYLDIFWNYWHPRRIDLNGNINSDFNLELLKNGHYSELTCKGYDKYSDKINLVLNSIKHNN
jgi:hypothetical protein